MDKQLYIERFWNKVNKSMLCWEWTASKLSNGYGQVWFGPRHDRKKMLAHRLSYELAFEEIPDGMCVLHKCDNKSCVNPSHLFLGTHRDNISDCLKKRRFTPCKLTLENVRIIRSSPHKSTLDLSKQFGVSKSAIKDVKNGRTWRKEHYE